MKYALLTAILAAEVAWLAGLAVVALRMRHRRAARRDESEPLNTWPRLGETTAAATAMPRCSSGDIYSRMNPAVGPAQRAHNGLRLAQLQASEAERHHRMRRVAVLHRPGYNGS